MHPLCITVPILGNWPIEPLNTFGAETVSLFFSGLESTQLGMAKVSRCPHFRGVLMEQFHYTNKLGLTPKLMVLCGMAHKAILSGWPFSCTISPVFGGFSLFWRVLWYLLIRTVCQATQKR